MKITRQTIRRSGASYRAFDMDEIVEMIKSDELRHAVERLRSQCEGLLPPQRNVILQRLPQLMFAGEFLKNRKGKYNGCIVVEAENVLAAEERAALKAQFAAFPQTLLAMEDAAGRGVVAVVRYQRPDGTLPEVGKAADMFHAHAYRDAVKTYEPETGVAIELKEPSVLRAIPMSYDADVYYNPNATVVLIDQPTEMPTDSLYEERCGMMTPMIGQTQSAADRHRYLALQYSLAFQQAMDKCEDRLEEGDFMSLLIEVGHLCHGAGIEEEECVQWTMRFLMMFCSENDVRLAIGNVYRTKKGFGDRPIFNREQQRAIGLKEYMRTRYKLRYNTMSDSAEYCENHSFHTAFKPVTNRVISSMALNAQEYGLDVWYRDVKHYVNSDRLPDYDPMKEFFSRLPKWDGKDRIRPLMSRVPTDNPMWTEHGYRWFISMVAHWQGRDEEHGNTLSPLLVGGQGCGKSTFCLKLLPPVLRQYYTDGIDLTKRRDCELALTRYLLINLDEFDQVTDRYQGFLKYLQQKASVSTRRPYAAQMETMKRNASFIATSNHSDLLSDPSGSRRFICVMVMGVIDNNQPIDYPQLYAQAVAALDSGERYWLEAKEEQDLIAANDVFRQRPLVEELFWHYYRPAEPGEDCLKLTAGEIFLAIQEKSKKDLGSKMLGHFGRLLKKLVPLSVRSGRGTLYLVVEK